MQLRKNASPAGNSSGGDNTPRLDTAWLDENLSKVGEKIPALAAGFNPALENQATCIRGLAQEIGKVWDEFKTHHCDPLVQAIHFFATLTTTWATEKGQALAAFERRCQTSYSDLSQGVKAVYRKALGGEEEQIAKLEMKRAEIQSEINRTICQATGTLDGHIPAIRHWAFSIVVETLNAIMLCAILAIEILIGLGFFREHSGEDTAFGLSTGVGVACGGLAYLAAYCEGPFWSSLFAKWAFKKRYPYGLKLNNEAVYPFVPSRLKSFVGHLSTALLVGFVFWLVDWRKKQAANDPSMEGTLIATYVLAVLVGGLFLFKLFNSEHLPKHLQVRYWKQFDEREAVSAEILGYDIGDPAPLIRELVDTYFTEIEEAISEIILQPTQTITHAVQIYTTVRDQLRNEAWSMLMSWFNAHYLELLKQMHKLQPGFDYAVYESQEYADAAAEQLLNYAKPFDDRLLFQMVTDTNFTIPTPRTLSAQEVDAHLDNFRVSVQQDINNERGVGRRPQALIAPAKINLSPDKAGF